MYVKDWMSKNPVYLTPDDSIIEAFNAMKEGNFHRVPIVDKGKLIGLITETTLADYSPSKATTLSVYEINSLLQKTKCGDIMIQNVVTIDPDALLEEAADKMMKYHVSCLPVISKETDMLVGIITQKVIFGAFVDLMGYYSKGSRIVVEVEEDVPGIMEKISSVLASEGISISHLCVYHYNNIDIVIRVYDDDAKKVADLLINNGYKVVDSRVSQLD